MFEEGNTEHYVELCRERDIPGARGQHSLLRLFDSDMFSSWMALRYLQKLDSSVGSHHYLCLRLRTLPKEGVTRLIPQLLHLAVTRSEASAPLECFLMELVRQSSHISSSLLWLLECYYNDYSSPLAAGPPKEARENASELSRVTRLLFEVQRAAFGRDAVKTQRPAPVANRRRRSLHHEDVDSLASEMPSVMGTLAGFGVSLMAFGQPHASVVLKPLALLEARTLLYCEISSCLLGERQHDGQYSASSKSIATLEKTGLAVVTQPLLSPAHASSPSLEELHGGNAFAYPSVVHQALAADLGPSSLKKKQRTHRLNLLYHADMQFVASLLEVSKRLCQVASREARVKTLRAELDLINHNLPAAVCLPFLCPSEPSVGHHRVLRVPSVEASILNSAERVPFLAFVEVLESAGDDMTVEELCQLGHQQSGGKADSAADSPLSAKMSEETTVSDVDMIQARTPTILIDRGDETEREEREERMRTAAIMLAQLNRQSGQPGANQEEIDNIRNKLIGEMEALERNRLLDALAARHPGTEDPSVPEDEDELVVAANNPMVIRDDPSAAAFKEPLDAKTERIRRQSPYGQLRGWRLLPVIFKADSDMRQELLAIQLINELRAIFEEERVDVWLSDMHGVLVAGPLGGLVEVIPNTLSVHSIKKAALEAGHGFTLREHFARNFSGGESYAAAVHEFARSLAGYSLFTYVFQVKDRHNGNILVDSGGHVAHIDFGFILSNTPGGSYSAVVTGGGGFETAPFKLTAEYIDLLNSSQEAYPLFKRLLKQGFLALRKHQERLVALLEVYALYGSRLPCMSGGGTSVLQGLAQRLALSMPDKQVEQHVERLIASSAHNMFTRLYDSFQYYSNGIL